MAEAVGAVGRGLTEGTTSSSARVRRRKVGQSARWVPGSAGVRVPRGWGMTGVSACMASPSRSKSGFRAA
jgi:hypothetical protein